MASGCFSAAFASDRWLRLPVSDELRFLSRGFGYLSFNSQGRPILCRSRIGEGEAAWEKVQLKNDRRFPTQTRFSIGGLSFDEQMSFQNRSAKAGTPWIVVFAEMDPKTSLCSYISLVVRSRALFQRLSSGAGLSEQLASKPVRRLDTMSVA
jgi:hypothetical protein